MKIAFLGNFCVDYTSETHHAESLKSLGHDIFKIQEPKVPANDIFDIAKKSDLFIWVHTHGWDTPGMKEVLQKLKILNIPTITYHLDLYMGLDRWEEYKDSPLWDIEYFFTVDRVMADYLNNESDVKGYFIPAGVYDKECYLLDQPKNKDVVFVGSRGYHPEWKYRPDLIDWLRKTYKDNFFHYGNDGLGVKRGHDLNRIYAQSKIVIGDTLCIDFKYPYYFSDRLFETTGRGGFIIFPYIGGIKDYFKIGKELVTYKFGDWKYLEELIYYYLEHGKEREKIRIAGHKRTKKDHTYKKRWEEILKVIK